jgi:hypothetical protein
MRRGKGYGIIFYEEWMEYLNNLDDAKRGKLFMALLELGFNGEVKSFNDPSLHTAYQIIGTEILYDIDKYKERCERNRKNAQKRRKIQPDEEKTE